MVAPIPTPLYHITHLGNLESIVQCGGVKCKSVMQRDDQAYSNIAHQNIQDRRRWTQVPCSERGCLHDYVPFYFAPRSPMLYAIHRAQVASCPEGQRLVVHLVSTAQAVEAAGIPFAFTDGHGTMALTDFFDDLQQLDAVDWAVMQGRYWNDTPNDGDRCRRRQAEFLVHDFFPWHLVTEIGVLNAQVQRRVAHAFAEAEHRPHVTVRPGWYY